MGLFSGKTTVQVAASVINLGGEIQDRPNFLKGTVFRSIIGGSQSLTSDITSAILEGPGLRQRKFYNWAKKENIAGMFDATVSNNPSISQADVLPFINVPNGLEIQLQTLEYSEGNFEFIIRDWINNNYPTRIAEAYLSDFDQATDTFSVQFNNGDFYTFSNPINYNPSQKYIIATYFFYEQAATGPVTLTGTTLNVLNRVDLSDYTFDAPFSSTNSIPTILNRNRVTEEVFSDGRPTNTTNESISVNANLNRDVEQYYKDVLVSINNLQTQGERQFYRYNASDNVLNDYFDETVTVEDIGGGVTKTTTVTTTGQRVQAKWTERTYTQDIFDYSIVGEERMWYYRIGSGNPTLDALVTESNPFGTGEFYPVLPIRIWNEFVDNQVFVDNGLYEETKTAYRRSIGGKLDDLIEELSDNENLGDITHAYIQFGAPLNTEDNLSKEYIFRFFERIMAYQNSTSGSTVAGLQSQIDDYNNAISELQAWEAAYGNLTGGALSNVPPKPTVPTVINIPEFTTVRFFGNDPKLLALSNDSILDLRLKWIDISIENVAGKYGTMKAGEFKIRKGQSLQVNTFTNSGGSGPNINFNSEQQRDIVATNIYHQVTNSLYRKMVIWELRLDNFIYGGNGVWNTPWAALDNVDEDGLVIPLHVPTLKEMGLVKVSEFALHNNLLLLISLKITKQKWYQSLFGRLVLGGLLLGLFVLVSPATFAAGSGLLGGNAALGAALGFSGTAAIVAGTIGNYVAGIIISVVLQTVGTELFGEKWGALFASIVMIGVMSFMSGTSLFSTENLMRFGNALANGYQGFIQGEIMEIQETIEREESQYQQQMERINNLMKELGGNDLNFDPLFLTNSVRGNDFSGNSTGYMPETPDEFIQRTTMTGSDLIELTHSLVFDYVDIQKTLPVN
jgi:hypothetical protein